MIATFPELALPLGAFYGDLNFMQNSSTCPVCNGKKIKGSFGGFPADCYNCGGAGTVLDVLKMPKVVLPEEALFESNESLLEAFEEAALAPKVSEQLKRKGRPKKVD